MSISLQQLAQSLELDFRGDPDLSIDGVASLASARPGDLCFIQEKKYLGDIATSACSVVLLSPGLQDQVTDRALLFSDQPYLSFIAAVHLLKLEPGASRPAGIHPSAQIAASANLAPDVSVGANAVIDENVSIGAGSRIGAGSVIESSVVVGQHCQLHSRVTLGHSVVLGDRCVLHPGVVIGSDGFGILMDQQAWQKIPHLGSVMIGDDVEIGANTTVDRGALDNTVIENGCKLDNQIQVAHNVRIGAHTAIAACVGIAGSADIGRYCKISGAAVVLGHLSIVDNVTITAMSLVTKDIKKPGVYSSGTPLLENALWHRNNVRYKSLDKLAQSIARLEKSSR